MKEKWIPGDCHGHIFMDGWDLKRASARHSDQVDEAWVRSVLSVYRDRKISFFREGGDPYGVSLCAARLAPEYGLDYLSPVFAIHKKNRYGRIVGRAFENEMEYHALVKEVKRLGGDFIKVMFSGILDFSKENTLIGTPLEEKEIREMIRIAHEEGMAVMAHVNGDETIRIAVEAGADSVEHGNFMSEKTVRILAESDTFWVPTVVPIANLLRTDRFEHEGVQKLVQRQKNTIRLAWELGGKVCLGSDAGAYAVPHSTGIEDEYELFAELNLKELDCRLEKNERLLKERFRNGYR